MGLETLVSEVRRKGQERAKEILALSEDESKVVVAKAQAEADAVMAQALRQGAQAVAAERAEMLSEAKSVASRNQAQARSQVVEAHLRLVWDEVLEFRKTDSYRRLLASLATEAHSAIGPGCMLFCRREDESLITPLKASSFIECEGGLLAQDAGGRIILDGRLETLFSESRERLSTCVYTEVFVEGR